MTNPNVDEVLHSQEWLDEVRRAAHAGRSMVPIADLATKKPKGEWKWRQVKAQPAIELIDAFLGPKAAPGVGVIGGLVSGGGSEAEPLWLVIVDFDTKYSGPDLPEKYRERLEAQLPGVWDRLPRESTPSGGLHVYFRSPVAIGCPELACGADGKPWIELRGEGGYAACAPTAGYTWQSGDLTTIPALSAEEVDCLLATATSFTQKVAADKKAGTYIEKEGLPGTEYVARMEFDEVLAYLVEHGWRVAQEAGYENVFLTRPGDDKRDGEVSANLRRLEEDGPPLLYVYTSSTEFEAQTAYTIFAIRAITEFDGDYRACAKALRSEGYGSEETEKKKAKPDDMALAKAWIEARHNTVARDTMIQGLRTWTGTHWHLCEEDEISRLFVSTSEVLQAGGWPRNHKKMRDVFALIKCKLDRSFTMEEDKVPFENGMLDHKTMTWSAHDPLNYNTYAMPFAYKPARFPLIWRFLRETIPDPIARRAYMTHVGLAMIRDMHLYKMVILYGGKRSGKGTCLKLANLACGQQPTDYAGQTIFDRDQEGLWARARHCDKRMACLDELPVEALQSEDLIKTMASHEGVPTRPLRGMEIKDNTWRPKMMASTNNRPRFADPSSALRERLLVIECPSTHTDSPTELDPAKKVDLYLLDKLRPDVPAFASMCMLYAKRALAVQHYPESRAMQVMLNAITSRGDALKSWLEDCCETGLSSESFTPTSLLYKSYEGYCKENGYKQLSKGRLLDAIQVIYPFLKETKRMAPVFDAWGLEKEGVVSQQRGLAGIVLTKPAEEVVLAAMAS